MSTTYLPCMVVPTVTEMLDIILILFNMFPPWLTTIATMQTTKMLLTILAIQITCFSSLGAAKLNKDSLLYKLRWVTLGYHYDWNNKLYYRNNYTPFPTNLSKLTQFILQLIGYATYRPEAAIVNYYHLDSTLSGHTDHSEHDLTAPLISIR